MPVAQWPRRAAGGGGVLSRSKDLPYMPLWVSKYDAKTKHLTLEEDGAYLRLLRLCWTTPGRNLPADDEWVRRQLRVDQDTYDRVVKIVLGEFFKVRAGRYVNDKLCEIFKHSLTVSSSRKEPGHKGGKASALKKKELAASKREANAKQNSSIYIPNPDLVISEMDSAQAREPESVLLEADCRKWANGSLVANFEGTGLSSIERLMQPPAGGEPCTRDDVRVGITETASTLHSKGRQVASLEYFEQPILRARDKRLSPLPKVEIIDERAGANQGGERSNHARRRSGAGPGNQHRGNGFISGLALLESVAEAQNAVPDGPEDWRDDRVAAIG